MASNQIVGFKTVLSTEVDSLNPVVGDLFINSDGTSGEITRDDIQRATQQGIQERLQLFLGEYFLNINEGIPYFQHILGKGRGLENIRRIIRQAILSYPGITSVDFVKTNFDRKTREISIDFTAKINNTVAIKSADYKPLVIMLR